MFAPDSLPVQTMQGPQDLESPSNVDEEVNVESAISSETDEKPAQLVCSCHSLDIEGAALLISLIASAPSFI